MTCTCPSHWPCQLTAIPAWLRNRKDLRTSRKPQYSSRDFSPSCLIIRNCWTGEIAFCNFLQSCSFILYDNPECESYSIISRKVSVAQCSRGRIEYFNTIKLGCRSFVDFYDHFYASIARKELFC